MIMTTRQPRLLEWVILALGSISLIAPPLFVYSPASNALAALLFQAPPPPATSSALYTLLTLTFPLIRLVLLLCGVFALRAGLRLRRRLGGARLPWPALVGMVSGGFGIALYALGLLFGPLAPFGPWLG